MRTSSKKTKRPLTARLSKSFGSLKDKFEKRLSQDMSKIKKEIKALESLDLKSKFELNPKASKGSLILCGEKVKNVPKLIDLTVRKMEEAYNMFEKQAEELSKQFDDLAKKFEDTSKQVGGLEKKEIDELNDQRRELGMILEGAFGSGSRSSVKNTLNRDYKKSKKEENETFKYYLKYPDEVKFQTPATSSCQYAFNLLFDIPNQSERIQGELASKYKKAIEELNGKITETENKIKEKKEEQLNKESNEQNKKIEDLNEKVKKEYEKLFDDIKKNLKNPLRSTLNKKPVANKSSKTLKIGTKIIKDCDELEEVTKKRLNFTINKLNEKVSTLSDTLTNYYDTVIDTIEKGNRLGIYDAKESERQKKEFGKRWQEEVAGCLNEDLDKLSNVKKTFNKLWKMNKKKEKENQETFEKLIDEPSFLKSAYTKGAKKNNSAVLYSVKLLHWLPQIFEKFGDKLENIGKVAFEFYKYS